MRALANNPKNLNCIKMILLALTKENLYLYNFNNCISEIITLLQDKYDDEDTKIISNAYRMRFGFDFLSSK